MTDRERAERIFYYVTSFPRYNTPDAVCIGGIAAQIEEAMRDALDNTAWGHLEKAAYDKGYAAARERAAGRG